MITFLSFVAAMVVIASVAAIAVARAALRLGTVYLALRRRESRHSVLQKGYDDYKHRLSQTEHDVKQFEHKLKKLEDDQVNEILARRGR